MPELFKPTLAQIASFQEWCEARDALNSKIAAFILLYGDPTGGEALPRDHALTRGNKAQVKPLEEEEGGDEDNMTGAIESIVNSLMGQKITLKQLKNKLRSDGFPDTRLQNYFYTAVRRLGKKERIRIWPDKTISQVLP